MTGSGTGMKQALEPVALEVGQALFICQIFEDSFVTLLSLLSEHKLSSDGAAFSASWDFQSSATLGQLLSALKRELELPVSFEEHLQQAINLHNDLVHGYLTRNLARLVHPKGRIEAIEELKAMQRDIRSKDKLLGAVIDKLLEKYGLSQHLLKEQAGRMWEWVNEETMNQFILSERSTDVTDAHHP